MWDLTPSNECLLFRLPCIYSLLLWSQNPNFNLGRQWPLIHSLAMLWTLSQAPEKGRWWRSGQWWEHMHLEAQSGPGCEQGQAWSLGSEISVGTHKTKELSWWDACPGLLQSVPQRESRCKNEANTRKGKQRQELFCFWITPAWTEVLLFLQPSPLALMFPAGLNSILELLLPCRQGKLPNPAQGET